MDLKLYNSLTRQVELFVPIEKNSVRLYCCGVTVYDHCHLGHGRSVFVLYDMLIRLFKALGYTVQSARNVTDIDDKIINKAHQTEQSWRQLADFYKNPCIKLCMIYAVVRQVMSLKLQNQ